MKPWHRWLARWHWLVGLVALVLATDLAQADRRFYFAPAARGNGSGTDAANARAFDVNVVNYQALADHSDPVAEIHFAPGVYSLKAFLFSPASANREAIGVKLIGDGERPEDTVIRNDKPLVWNTEDRMARLNGLGRIELENLTFDGNWDEKIRQSGHAAFNPNYKNQPLNLTARTGRVRRVIVRNCGSIGYLPQSRFDNSAGTEAFPLAVGTTDVGQEPAPGDPAPWVVEDCEVHGFHPEYGGYSTLVMGGGARFAGVTPDWAAADTDRRMLVVRRCQVRGVAGGAGVIALGSSGCESGVVDGGKVTWSDNVILNASLGFNTDCGRVTGFWITNSLFLDVWTVGNVGALYPGTMDGYRVTGNAVRLSGRGTHRTYSSFAWRGTRMVTDPGLVLGREETNDVSGLATGSAGKLQWERNWFTTRPRAAFARDGLTPGFRLFRKYTSSETGYAGGFPDIQGIEAAGNALSGVGWDFDRLATLPGGSHGKFGPDTVPDLTRVRMAVSDGPAGFDPIGTVERVLPVYARRVQRWEARVADSGGGSSVRRREATEPVLVGALEVALGRPRWEPGADLRLSARLALQAVPSAGGRGTVPLAGSNVWVEVLSPFTARLSGVTDSRGVVEFRIPARETRPGQLQLRAYHGPPNEKGSEVRFNEYRTAFATAKFSPGTVVSIESGPDVAQVGGSGARFVVSRTGRSLAELPEVEVYFRLATDVRPARPGDEFELIARGAARANLEGLYRGGIGRLTFAVGDRSASIEVIPKPRAAERSSLVQLRLLGGSGQRYGVGSTNATVVLLPGPEWAWESLPVPAGASARVVALSPVTDSPAGATAYAVGVRRDAARRESGILWRRGSDGVWAEVSREVPDLDSVSPVSVAVGTGGRPLVLGNRRTGPSSGAVWAPWWNGARAWEIPPGVPTVRLLAVNESGDERLGISGEGSARQVWSWPAGGGVESRTLPDGGRDVEPVTGLATDGRWAGNGRWEGRARAFRAGAGGDGAVTWLPGLDANAESAVTALAPSGLAVGWSGKLGQPRPVMWPSDSATPVELPRPSGTTEALPLAVNAAGEVVGVAGNGGRWPELYWTPAVANGAWRPLTDAHFVGGLPEGWEPGQPVGINRQGWIAGNGRRDGREQPWIIRRTRARP